MKRGLPLLLIFFLAGVFMADAAPAEEQGPYMSLKGGLFIPAGDLSDAGFDTGYNGEAALGYAYSEHFSLEAAAGFFFLEGQKEGRSPALGSFREDNDLWAIPVTVTFLATYPCQWTSLYGGAGVGVYFSRFQGTTASTTQGTFEFDDGDAAFEAHAAAGATVAVTSALSLGVEGKYVYTDKAEYQDTVGGVSLTKKMKLNGYMVMANLKFSF
jgi:opacity protein-like surface antigen